MANRWIAWCRRLSPEGLRHDVFDPSVADLLHAAASARLAPHRLSRLLSRPRLFWQVAWVALECRRLATLNLARLNRVRRPAGTETRGLPMPRLLPVLRRLWREPRLTLAVVLTLALGLGANLTVFTFVDAFLLAPLNVPQAADLYRVGGDAGDGDLDVVSYPNYVDGRDGAASQLDLAAHTQVSALVGPADQAQERTVEVVSGNYFRVMRVVPQLGRLLDGADDEVPLAQPVAVVSDGYWRTQLGGRAGVLGESLFINGSAFQIVGVAPVGFVGTYAARRVDVWTPTAMQQVVRPRGLTRTRRGWGWLQLVGRVTPGATRVTAEQALAVAADDINRRFPVRAGTAGFGFALEPLSALSTTDARRLSPLLRVAFAFTALLFLATCANLAGLMHSRFSTRRHELAIRQSLGAGRGRLMWEWMAECLLLAIGGGAVSVMVARVTAVTLATVDLPESLFGSLSLETTLHWRVVAYAVGLSLCGGVLFGLTGAWRSGRQLPVTVLKAEGGHLASGRGYARRVMVAAQIGTSVTLLMLAALLITSLRHQQRADTGFDAAPLGLLSVNLQRQRIPETEWIALTQRMVDQARAVPGVAQADVASRAPLSSGMDRLSVAIPGYVSEREDGTVSVDFAQVGPAYFDTLGLTFERGGTWTPTADRLWLVVNHTMAVRYWNDEDPVGRSITIGGISATVSGVVRDSAYYSVGESPRPFMYLPAHVQPPGQPVLHIRAEANADPAVAAATVAKAIAEDDDRLVAYDVMSFEQARSVPLFPNRMLTMAALVLGAVSLLLTIVGLYGVIASSVSARTREIGVRIALGAAPDRVQRGVIGEALRLAAVGCAAGLTIGYLSAFQLREWLFDVGPFNVATTALAVTAIVVVAVAAAWMPARRASRVDPVQALRG